MAVSKRDEVCKSLVILQIEDNRVDAELALLELSSAGLEVRGDVVDTLAEVDRLLAASSYDVVLADYRLPGWVGTDALPMVRQYQGAIPFILVTGTLGDEVAVECVKNGVTDFVHKDHLARLPLTIRRALREKTMTEERNRALQALAESEERFRNLVEASPDAIFVHHEGTIVFCNPATLRLLGAQTPGQLLGKSIFEFIRPDHRQAVERHVEVENQQGTAITPLEHVKVRLDGSCVDVEAHGIPMTWKGSPAIEVVVRDITERKRAEKRIAHLASFPELSPMAIFESDLEGKITYANPAALRMFPDLLHSGLAQAPLQEWLSVVELFKTGKEQEITREIEAEGSFILQTIQHTAELGVLRAYMMDITERKQAEEARRASEQVVLEWKKRLELAERAALPIRLWEWDIGGDTLLWSGEGYRELGYSSGDFRGQDDFLNRVHPEDRLRVEAAVQAVVSGLSRTYAAQFRIIRPNGTTGWLDSRGVMVPDGSPRMIGIAIDITKLRDSEANYRSIFETAPYGIFRSGMDGGFLVVNPTLIQMLGYDRESELLALDMPYDVYCNPGEQALLTEQLVSTGRLKDVEVEWNRKNGRSITVRISAVPVRKASGEMEAFQGFVQDVTERKLLAKQFWQAQKMEAIGRLAGGVAHDFNNVLMIVGSYADLITQREVADEKVNHYAGEIRQAATRAVSITRQLLAFSRQQVLELEVLDLNTVVAELGKLCPRFLGEDIAVGITLEAALKPVKLDRGQVEQIIMNLAVNARDAMPKGGRFEIRTQNVQVDAAYAAAHPPIQPGSYVKLAVADTGMGMDAETQARIFEPFFTTKERGKGTGLGLATIYGIVKQSGGFIWMTSAVGRGTTFDVYFPQVGESIRETSKPYQAKSASQGSETILLVEDEAAVRDSTCEFLRSRGYTVHLAGDGTEALRACEQHGGAIDLMLTDLVMPGMDGIELAKAVTTRYPDMRVLYMSGYTDRMTERLGPEAVLLQKPFTLTALAGKLHAVLESRKANNN